MTFLPVPVVRRKQPITPVRINWNHPVARKLSGAWNFVNGPVDTKDLTGKSSQFTVNTAVTRTRANTKFGTAATKTTTNYESLFTKTAGVTTQSAIIFGRVNFLSASLITNTGSTAYLWIDSSGFLTLYLASATRATAGTAVAVGDNICAGFNAVANNEYRVFLNGRPESSINNSNFGGAGNIGSICGSSIKNGGFSTALLLDFHTKLTEQEHALVYENPWALLQPETIPLFYSTSSGQAVSPAVGSIALTGYAPGIAQPQTSAPLSGSLAISGYAPTVAQSAAKNIIPEFGSLAISGYAPIIAQPVALAPGCGSLTLAGYAPSVDQSAGANVLPAVGNLTITGYAPSVAQPIAVQPAAGGLTIAGYAPAVAQPNDVAVGAGSVTITGFAPGIAQPQTAAPGVGSVALVGYAPSVVQASSSPNLMPGAGSLSLAGHAPTVEQLPPAVSGGGRFKRKRVFIDGKSHFLNPLEVANLLIARAASVPDEAQEEPGAAEEAASIEPAIVPAIDYAAIKASSVQASQAFIDRMNFEIERMRGLAIQRQLDEEDDIECLMLLL